ncbi:MAG: bifunctional UDP-N-acetylglucosamine diphosphorylase/glucosamine-1-phosphate N-acetyltransferase GlmU [Bdellovibrionales bacterium]|nr:bifunctional UDP-N-acetylglucosamine diphosphorylase/glucosamine-1-phosphate N-acetyltransferase GlmU [Bdellovibrionales bacterium]
MSSSLEIIVLAAGKGTRMKSQMPKVLHRLCGRTLLERVLRAGAALAPKKIVVVAGYGEDALRKELELLRDQAFLSGIEVEVRVQAEQRGTGHAAEIGLAGVSANAELVLVLPGDGPLLRGSDLQPLAAAVQSAGAELGVLTCLHPNPEGFGRIIRSESGAVEAIVEEKDCSKEQRGIQEINTSIYLGRRSFFAKALPTLESKNAQGELYLTDVVKYAVQNGCSVVTVTSDDTAPVLGANTRHELSQLEALRRHEINRAWMEAGVTLEDPVNTYIDEDVEIGPDTFIGAGTRLRGRTIIENNVRIEGLSLIQDSHIETGSHIRLSCEIERSKVGAECDIGPFAHLRPGSFLWEKVKIGNFVETKKVELHRGVKANHLTYLGDAEVGGGTNIGAGTITCNYDGLRKHQTKIGAACFIGSNTALVAPVEVGSGAYVGAGSTITQSVPGGALGVARGAQRNIEGWAARKKITAREPEQS